MQFSCILQGTQMSVFKDKNGMEKRSSNLSNKEGLNTQAGWFTPGKNLFITHHIIRAITNRSLVYIRRVSPMTVIFQKT